MIKMLDHFNVTAIFKRTAIPGTLLLLSGCASINYNLDTCMEWQENAIPNNLILAFKSSSGSKLSESCNSGRAAAGVTVVGKGKNGISAFGHAFAREYLKTLDEKALQELAERERLAEEAHMAMILGDTDAPNPPSGPTEAQKAKDYYIQFLKRHGLSIEDVLKTPQPPAPQHPQAAPAPVAPPNCVVTGTNPQGKPTFNCN